MGVKHRNTATRDDGVADGRVQPSWWNLDHDIGAFLTAIIDLAVTPGTFPYIKADGTASVATMADFARTLLALSSAPEMLAALGGASAISPTLSGTPSAPTAPLNTNTTQIATMAALQAMRADLVASAPGTLDTLNEFAIALGNDPNFATTIFAALAARVRFDAAQSLTTGQKAQVLSNLGVILGTAAALNAGTAALNLVQLDAAGKMPPVDGSQLTNIVAVGGLSAAAGTSNVTFAVTAAAGALTVAVKTVAGVDPSPVDPAYFFFQTLTGGFVRIGVTAPISFVIGSTKTLGMISGQGARLYLTAHNDAGVVRLGGFVASDASGWWCPQDGAKYTTSVPGNASRVFCTGTAIAVAAPWRFIGVCEWSSLAVAGTWVPPDNVYVWSAGSKKPGDSVQRVQASATAGNTNTTGNYVDAGLSGAITPSSTANFIRVNAGGSMRQSVSGHRATARLARSSNANMIGPGHVLFTASGGILITPVSLRALDKPNTTASITYYVMILDDGTGSTVWNDGGTNTVMELEEIHG